MMTSTRLILGVCIVLSAVAAPAGEVAPVACDPSAALDYQPRTSVYGMASKPAEGSGAVDAKAVVLMIHSPAGQIAVAVDSAKPDAKAADTLRFDFTGKGQFAGAPTVPIKPPPGRGYQTAFGPQTVQAALPGGTIPVTVHGQYIKSDDFRYMTLHIGTAVQGKGRFGKRVLPVRIIDGNGNLKAGDTWRTSGRSTRRGDTLAIDLGDGSFTKDVRKACYGSPIEVDGAWYSVGMAADGKTLTVNPIDVKLGKIHIKQPKWSCMLVGQKHLLYLAGGDEPVAVPVDTYLVTRYQQWSTATASGQRAHLKCTDFTTRGAERAMVAVEAGKTAAVEIGSPLTASIHARSRSNGKVSLSLSLTDAAQRSVSSLTLPNGRRPDPPKVTVRDADGKTVYTCALEYG